ncbi:MULTISPECIES: DUF1365 domain-containing protein [unclassified Beijerinckia]|uniref:DUF1365 domain-containing protein n=1 Tax=unclassified Beijerinckia TaxID=2638183 RepID=UPI000896B021|nr:MULTISPECIES: DUF1365 domain-containing protein [unclassified Beijerinckia]MDH7795374.1 DUF1365 family protein [Beijerinckia sp. GAS462]SEB98930.1 hypothetical protein SAMN05443249_1647 [Beijerinckia sp. 28-YEA-48]
MTFHSRLYVGTVTHLRLRPRRHRLRHSCFWLCLDLEEIDMLACKLWWFSSERFNLMSFRTADHGDGSPTPLRQQVERHLRQAGLDPQGGTISLLTMPRVLWYGFNPISVYFCRDRDGRLQALVYQVHNTFGERHSYLIPVEPDRENGDSIRQTCRKEFYVSPFMDMDMVYNFKVQPPGERVTVAISSHDNDGPVLQATLSGKAMAISDRTLMKLSLANPFLTLKVIAAIHVHALVIWLKGIRLRARPKAPEQPVTQVSAR